jgi:quinolinate synthase
VTTLANEIPSVAELHERLRKTLADVAPDFELKLKAETAHEILQLKAERNAVVLAHNYMEPALYASIPDFTGDSLELCRKAATTDADVIVFCGVRFMAETAKVLNPRKTVLLPDPEAGCSLAAGITAADVRGLKRRYPGVPVVAYVNTNADVKAEVDVCCTSSNAARVVESLGDGPVIFVPDEYLARNVAAETGRSIRFPGAEGEDDAPLGDRTMIGWPGRCEVHEKFTPQDVLDARRQFPDVTVLAHPECSPDVVAECDFTGSTKAMIDYVERSDAGRYLLLTECAMGDNVAAANPGKEMLRLCSVRCPHMNRITLEQTLRALREDHETIEVDERVVWRAARSLERMIEIG